MMPPNNQNAIDCLVFIAQMLGIHFDERELRNKFEDGDVSGLESIRLGVKSLKLKSRLRQYQDKIVGNISLPAIAACKKDVFVVILRFSAEKLMIFDPRRGKPEMIATADFTAMWNGSVVEISRPFSFQKIIRELNLAWFTPVLWRYRHAFYQVILMSFLLQIFALATPIFIQTIIDKVLPHKGIATLNILILIIFLAYLFQSLMNYLRTYIFSHTTNKVDAILGATLYRQLCMLPLRYFETRQVGDTVTRVRELENIRGFLTGTSLTALLDAFFGIIFVAVMFFYNSILTLVVLAVLPLFVGICAYFTPVMRAQYAARFVAYMENYSFLVESLTGIQTVKSLSLEPQFNKKWEDSIARYVRVAFQTSKVGNIFNNLSTLVGLLANLSILWAGAHLVINGELTVGQFVAFNMLSSQAIHLANNISNQWQAYQQARLSLVMLGDVLNSQPETTPKPELTDPPIIRGNIKFSIVNFRYRLNSPMVIQDMSFEIQPGQRIGIVGRSGSGKSTIAKLIQRLYVPEQGSVLLDGLDITQIDTNRIRQQIGTVMQENFLFNGSVRDNIAMARPSASMDEVIAIACTAGAHEFIVNLPEGYDTNVGERGTALSGGQKQRIAIARVLMTNPRILIFDEATSQLDYESERIILKNLDKICADRTVIFIAHRLSTVRTCDLLFVIDRGKLIEQGTHSELISQAGLYAELYQQQFGKR